MPSPRPRPIRPPGWPEQRPLAVSVSIMLEGWAEGAVPGIGPMGNPLKAGVFDTQARSWGEYGAKTGAWHLLDLLDSCNVTATFYVSGVLAARHPDLMRAIVAAGHAIGLHAWSQHIIPATQTREEEHADLKRCIEALTTHAGVRPRGWVSPRATPSRDTPELLVREGVVWHADAFDQDTPYMQKTASGDILTIPFTMEVNDFPLCVRYGNAPAAFTRVLASILDGWAEIGSPVACLDLTAHAHVFGRPAGLIVFKEALRMVAQSPSAWLTHHAQLASLYKPLPSEPH